MPAKTYIALLLAILYILTNKPTKNIRILSCVFFPAPQLVQDVRGSVFYPLLNSIDNISVQIYWAEPAPRPSAYDIRIMCVNSNGQLENITVS